MSREYIGATLRREVVERAGGCCEYCRISHADQFFAFQIDHIISEKHGGPTVTSNLSLSCPDCNAFKGSDIASVDWERGGEVVPLFNPRLQEWERHFAIDNQTGEIQPLSPEGRVTIRVLRINDAERIKDRLLLIQSDRYPCHKP
jgi:hypothetical protein